MSPELVDVVRSCSDSELRPVDLPLTVAAIVVDTASWVVASPVADPADTPRPRDQDNHPCRRCVTSTLPRVARRSDHQQPPLGSPLLCFSSRHGKHACRTISLVSACAEVLITIDVVCADH